MRFTDRIYTDLTYDRRVFQPQILSEIYAEQNNSLPVSAGNPAQVPCPTRSTSG